MKTPTPCLSILLLLISLSQVGFLFGQPLPNITPVDPREYLNELLKHSEEYYIGFGFCSKENPNYTEIAKNKALAELSSQIYLSIDGIMESKTLSQSDTFNEEFSSYIKTKTQAKLSELKVDRIIDNKAEYWVFYKLSRLLYHQDKQQRLRSALTQSVDHYLSAGKKLEVANISSAIQDYLLALQELEEILGEDTSVEIEGRKVYLDLEIWRALNELGKDIAIRQLPIPEPITASKQASLAIYVSYQNKPVSGLKLNFFTLEGSSIISNSATSDKAGLAELKILKPISKFRNHIVSVSLNMQEIMGQYHLLPMVELVDKALNFNAKITFEVNGLPLFLESKVLEDSKSPINIMEPVLMEYLTAMGHRFVQSREKAEFIIRLVAETTMGGEALGFTTALTNAELQITRSSDNEVIFSKTASLVKGSATKYEQALVKSCENAAKQLMEGLVFSKQN